MAGTRYNSSMQIKKVDWINRPQKVKITAHTLSFRSSGIHKALYTLEEKGCLELEYEGNDICFFMLHTPSDAIFFSLDKIYGSMFNLSFSFPAKLSNRLIIEKDGEKITFISKEETVLEISNPAFLDSASFGFVTGKDTTDVSISFF